MSENNAFLVGFGGATFISTFIDSPSLRIVTGLAGITIAFIAYIFDKPSSKPKRGGRR